MRGRYTYFRAIVLTKEALTRALSRRRERWLPRQTPLSCGHPLLEGDRLPRRCAAPPLRGGGGIVIRTFVLSCLRKRPSPRPSPEGEGKDSPGLRPPPLRGGLTPLACRQHLNPPGPLKGGRGEDSPVLRPPPLRGGIPAKFLHYCLERIGGMGNFAVYK